MIEGLQVAGALDVVDTLRAERSVFVDLLRSLDAADWHRGTECPAYDVQGIAAHLLGDDLSLLSRQRDAAPPGLMRLLEPGDDFRTALNRFNDRWVEAAEFFSPPVLVELLVLTGEWTADWYRDVDPESLGEPVGFFGATGPSPYWQISAREYVERWVHHHQIRRACGRPHLDDPSLLEPAAAIVARGLAVHLRDLAAQDGDSVTVSVDGLASWTVVREQAAWRLFDGRPEHPTAEVALDTAVAPPALSRGMVAAAIEAAFRLEGDEELARRAAKGIAALAGR